MIRTFALAMVALAALALVAHHLPPALRPHPGRATAFGRWEGEWEGTYVTYRPDGTALESSEVRVENNGVSDGEQTVVITRRRPDGHTVMTSGRRSLAGDTMEYRFTNPDGTLETLSGRRVGDAIFWHPSDPAVEGESYREEILPTADGDLYLVDGAMLRRDGHGMLLFEGRYHRVSRATE